MYLFIIFELSDVSAPSKMTSSLAYHWRNAMRTKTYASANFWSGTYVVITAGNATTAPLAATTALTDGAFL